ncbi:MAG TPA: tetratricopeptide repeat protein, partial [Ignavibacteriales bacterium]|nr:tetratricopeptide repeat protein [Ignavibacteriales bacterium]
NNETAHYNLGIGYLSQKQYPEAITSFKEALKINSHFSQAHFAVYCSELANDELLRMETGKEEPSEEYKGKIDSLKVHFEMAIMSYPFFEWKLAYLLLSPKQYTFDNYTQLMIDEYYARFYDGYELFCKGDYDNAIGKFSSTLDEHPAYRDVRYCRGLAYALKNDYQSAIKDFHVIADSMESKNAQKILPIYLNAAEIYFLIGCAQNQLNNLAEAEAAFQKTLIEDYSFYMAHYHLAEIYHKQKRYKDALAELDAGILVDPKDYVMHYNKAVFLFEIKKYNESLEEYEETIRLNPKHYKSRYNAALIYEAMKNYDKALEHYQGFIDGAPLSQAGLVAQIKEKINSLKSN